MDSTRIGGKKQNPSKIQYYPSNSHFPQPSFQMPSNPAIKSHKKRVQFKAHTTLTKQETVGNGKYNPSGPLGLKQSTSEEYDQMPSSTNMYSPGIPMTDNKVFCSARATVLTFIIAIMIISAAAVAVGITIGTTKSSANSSGTGTGSNNNNQNSVSTQLTTAVTSSVSIGSQTGAPCSSYTTINDPTRSIHQSGSFGSCDNGPLFNASNGGSWIRFIGVGGTTMTDTSPGRSNCGAFMSGWFNDTLPTAVGTVNTGTVCLSVRYQPCPIIMTISVVNCGGFYVYFLPPMPVCNARYCTA